MAQFSPIIWFVVFNFAWVVVLVVHTLIWWCGSRAYYV